MGEIGSLEKHPCAACGGDLEWSASKRVLQCPYCGTIGEGMGEQGSVVERDLLEALARIGQDSRGYRAECKTVKCNSCHALSVFESTRVAQRCDFCGSPSIAVVDEMEDVITPESLLPAVVGESQVRDRLREWYGSRWFTPTAMKTRAMTDQLHGVYLPYWTFDAQVRGDWQAEVGYHYYVSESYRDGSGNRQTRRVRKTRWEDGQGQVEHFFDDEIVPGTVGVHLELLRKVEPFPTKTQLVAYDSRYIRGWTVERYQVDLRKAVTVSEERMEEQMRQLCERDAPGDEVRNMAVQLEMRGRTFKHVLVPVWLVNYTYGGKSYQVVVNGYTGKVAGEYPLSWVKIVCFVLMCLVVLGLILRFNPM